MHREMKFSSSIVHRLRMHELHHDGSKDEILFILGQHSVRFFKVEFCLIIKLKLRVIPDSTRHEMVENGIHQWYFSGQDEVEYEQLRAILQISRFEQQYNAIKLCLLYMLNWKLIWLDEREIIPVLQIRLVEDLDTFDVFLWGAHEYMQSLFGFKHVLDGRLFEKTELLPIATKRGEWYYKGIVKRGNLYNVEDSVHISVSETEHHTTARTSDTKGSKPDGCKGTLERHRRFDLGCLEIHLNMIHEVFEAIEWRYRTGYRDSTNGVTVSSRFTRVVTHHVDRLVLSMDIHNTHLTTAALSK
ncbi:hypothetical protein Ddye_004681 [Dipteronia dyeriana]|uniref:DUF1985 domain-containing protein n=1 Tax=Dipteronia dyeriana TaxID=168575 RepID=A0AAD9XFL6_9ROSI|nr:hypothetical protein Ddye_004681 [Dipteronia dyeriana]